EAEDIAVAGCCAIILWIKSQLTDYDSIYENYQLADIFTKPLDELTFKRLIGELGPKTTGGPTSLGFTGEARANPQLSSVVSTAEADPRKSVPSDFVPQQLWASFIARQVKEEEASSTIKLEDLAKSVSNVRPSFKYLDSPKDDYVIVVDDSDEDEEDEVLDYALSKAGDQSVPSADQADTMPAEGEKNTNQATIS
nr:hypothetical protein [Tanacetum cinerariifolium]